MSFNVNIPGLDLNIGWFMFDIDNLQLITNKYIPSEINDNKSIFYVETEVPGLSYSPVAFSGMGNRKLSFSFSIIEKNNSIGNLIILSQMKQLRQPKTGLLGVLGDEQFKSNPRVLYSWGTGSIPLVYYVSKCDFVHKSNMTNQVGSPQNSEVQIELILDEPNVLNQVENTISSLTSKLATVNNVVNSVGNFL